MSSGEEILPNPDEFGQIPPRQIDPAAEQADSVAPPPTSSPKFPAEIESHEDYSIYDINLSPLEDQIIEYDISHLSQEYHFLERFREGYTERHRDIVRESLAHYLHIEREEYPDFGSLYLGAALTRPVEPEKKPEPRPDPYPSRSGWREPFVSLHDPNATEEPGRPKGKIGDYDIVESHTTFADVGGNERAKGLLQEIAHQFAHPELYKKWDVPVPKGVLLHGEPGTGKTMLARAFAGEAGAAFVDIPVAALRDKYYGETEKNLKGIFDEAAKYDKPVVLFFDEINSLLPDRSRLSPDHPDARMVETFLQAVDGLQSATNVLVLGATNYPDTIDAAAARPGRLDQKVAVELPSKAACQEILAKQLLSSERKAGRVLAADELGLDEIGDYLEGLTGAHIAEVLNRVKRTMAQTERAIGAGVITLDPELEAIDFGDKQRDEMLITTADILAMTINYRLDMVGVSPKDKPGDDEPPAGVLA